MTKLTPNQHPNAPSVPLKSATVEACDTALANMAAMQAMRPAGVREYEYEAERDAAFERLTTSVSVAAASPVTNIADIAAKSRLLLSWSAMLGGDEPETPELWLAPLRDLVALAGGA